MWPLQIWICSSALSSSLPSSWNITLEACFRYSFDRNRGDLKYLTSKISYINSWVSQRKAPMTTPKGGLLRQHHQQLLSASIAPFCQRYMNRAQGIKSAGAAADHATSSVCRPKIVCMGIIRRWLLPHCIWQRIGGSAEESSMFPELNSYRRTVTGFKSVVRLLSYQHRQRGS